jgi:uncharacterized protein (TIGR00255 family)
MALRSMTGFGRAQGEVRGVSVAVEVRSVNHKGLDLKISLPSSLSALEPEVSSRVKARAGRGRVDVRLSMGVNAGARPLPTLDKEALRALVAQLEPLRRELGAEPLRLEALLSVKGIMLSDPSEQVLEESSWPALLAFVDEALERHGAEQVREGAALAQDMMGRLRLIASRLEVIAAECPKSKDAYLESLRERVQETAQRFGLGLVSEERLSQEVILYADRCDITEEVIRARTHLAMLLDLIAQASVDESLGKKLDFYFQELIRETNTMGSKSQSAVIAGCVVEIRTEIERLREQVQNVA